MTEGAPSLAVQVFCLGAMFLVRLEVAVLTLALPFVAEEFGCSLETAAWANFMPSFIFIMFGPAAGTLSDIYGHALVVRLGMLFIVVATWLSAWSPSLAVLLGARVLYGFASCSFFVAAFPCIVRGLDPERRGAVGSQVVAVEAIGSGLGVAFGGMVIGTLGWRWVFLLPAPLMTVLWLCFSCAPLGKHEPPEEPSQRRSLRDFDWPGTGLFGAFMFCLLLGVNRGNDVGWTSPVVLALFAGALVLIPGLVLVERRASEPILAVHLIMGTRQMLMIMLTKIFNSLTYGGTVVLVPLFLEEAAALPPGLVGRMLCVRPLAGSAMSAIMAVLIARRAFRMRMAARAGASVFLVSATMLLLAAPLRSQGWLFYAWVEAQLVLQAAGMFSAMLPLDTMFQADLPEARLAAAGALSRVASGFGSLMAQTAGLSLVRAVGSETEAASFQPVWLVFFTFQALSQVATWLVPATAELGTRAEKSPGLDEVAGSPVEKAPLELADESCETV